MAATSTPPGMIDITIDGQPVRVSAATTVFDAARMNGINIPTLCHLQNQTPVGVCRLCVVDTGARVLAASCVRPVEPGMKVVTNSEKVLGARKTLLELMMSDHPPPCARQQNSGDCELETLAKEAGASQPRFAKRTIARGKDDSSLAIAVDHDAGILCDRCIGVCGTFLELNRGAIVKRRFRKGEVICREGEFGSTAFYILEGQARVSISTPIAHVKTQGGAKGFFKRLTSTLVAREEDKREEEARD